MRKNLLRSIDSGVTFGLKDSKTATVSAGDPSVSLTDLNFESGDLFVVLIGSDSFPTTGTRETGWNELVDWAAAADLVIDTKVSDGTETTWSRSGTSHDGLGIIIAVFAGIAEPDVTDVTVTSAGGEGAVDPPSEAGPSPSPGICIACGVLDDVDGTLTGPTGFENIASVGITVSIQASTTSMAWKEVTASTNPPAFGGDTGFWSAATVICNGVA